jgi:hypothetical protein
VLFFDRADRDAKPVGDFTMGKEFDLAQQEHGAAAGWQFRDRLLEVVQFLAGDDFLRDVGCAGRRVGIRGFAGEGGDAAAFQPVDGEPPGGGVKQGLGFRRSLSQGGTVDAQVGVVGDVLPSIRAR